VEIATPINVAGGTLMHGDEGAGRTMHEDARNATAFLWHAWFLALATTLTDLNTILPALIVHAGGTSFEVGILTAIMIGTPILGQLIFASYLHLKPRKKGFLLLGINLRILALILVAVLLWGVEISSRQAFSGGATRGLVMLIMLIFAIAGTFAGIAYTDLLGRSLPKARRPMFFVVRQVLTSVGFLISALIARKVLACYTYPWNYVWLFSTASGLLLVASFGFWALKEEAVAGSAAQLTFARVLRSLPARFRADRELRRYIYLVNLTGFGLTLMPFYVTLVKERHGLTGEQVGTYLLANIVGMIVSNFLWARVVRRHGFRGVIRGCVICGALLPVLALVLVHSSTAAYLIVFVLMGAALSARRIAFPGLLIEITTAENRALHMGMVGATSFSTAIFPILAGGLIATVGYAPVFILGSLLVAWAFRFTGVHGGGTRRPPPAPRKGRHTLSDAVLLRLGHAGKDREDRPLPPP